MFKASTNINNQPHLKSLSIKQTTTNGVENTGLGKAHKCNGV